MGSFSEKINYDKQFHLVPQYHLTSQVLLLKHHLADQDKWTNFNILPVEEISQSNFYLMKEEATSLSFSPLPQSFELVLFLASGLNWWNVKPLGSVHLQRVFLNRPPFISCPYLLQLSDSQKQKMIFSPEEKKIKANHQRWCSLFSVAVSLWHINKCLMLGLGLWHSIVTNSK